MCAIINVFVLFRNEARSVSMFAEAANCVQRVVVQHSIDQQHDVQPGDGGGQSRVVSLSPPSQSALMMRRRALYTSQSSARRSSCVPLLEETSLQSSPQCKC